MGDALSFPFLFSLSPSNYQSDLRKISSFGEIPHLLKAFCLVEDYHWYLRRKKLFMVLSSFTVALFHFNAFFCH